MKLVHGSTHYLLFSSQSFLYFSSSSTSQSSMEMVPVFGQVPLTCLGRYQFCLGSYVTCLGSYQLLYRSGCPHCLHLMTAHLVYWRCLMPSLCCSSAFFLWYQAGFLGCGSPPGPKGSSDRRLVSAVPEVSGGKMKTTACHGASGREGRGV